MIYLQEERHDDRGAFSFKQGQATVNFNALS